MLYVVFVFGWGSQREDMCFMLFDRQRASAFAKMYLKTDFPFQFNAVGCSGAG